ncbi:MAG: GNAT family N-acetyltransferase [Candidatus Gracilibacteria bacterium]
MQKINNLSDYDYEIIEGLIDNEGLSYYEIKKDDFICYKEGDKIISFGRIFNIGGSDYELSSLWVDEKYRGKKLGIEMINDLLKNKFYNDNNLFLACKRDIQNYYKKVNFEIVDKNIPEKLEGTLRWGKENNFDAIIMKYIK